MERHARPSARYRVKAEGRRPPVRSDAHRRGPPDSDHEGEGVRQREMFRGHKSGRRRVRTGLVAASQGVPDGPSSRLRQGTHCVLPWLLGLLVLLAMSSTSADVPPTVSESTFTTDEDTATGTPGEASLLDAASDADPGETETLLIRTSLDLRLFPLLLRICMPESVFPSIRPEVPCQ